MHDRRNKTGLTAIKVDREHLQVIGQGVDYGDGFTRRWIKIGNLFN